MRQFIPDLSMSPAQSAMEAEGFPREGATTTPVPVVEAVATTAKRWLALDLFRFAAVCMMVQGHVFSTLLDEASRAYTWQGFRLYAHHSFVHGYTAPMFLFGAGLAFGYTTFRRWAEHTAPLSSPIGRAAARKRFQRYGWLLLIGYGLHLPTLSLSRLLAMEDPHAIARMLQVDVLQHIGVSLAICQTLLLFVKNRRVFVGLVAVLGVFCIMSGPWIWRLDLADGTLPIWLAGYLNPGYPLHADGTGGSLFPLIPWAGFTYTGIVVAYAVGVAREQTGRPSTDGHAHPSVSERVAWPFLALALFFMLVPIVVDRFGPFPWPPHNFWKTNPLFFFWRLGNVMLVLAVLCFAERLMSRLGWLADGAPRGLVSRLLPWVKLVGAESLIIYVMHLVVLHGSVLGPGIKHTGLVEARAQGVLMASLVTVVIFLLMVALARLWSQLRRDPRSFRLVQVSLVGLVVVLMLTGR